MMYKAGAHGVGRGDKDGQTRNEIGNSDILGGNSGNDITVEDRTSIGGSKGSNIPVLADSDVEIFNENMVLLDAKRRRTESTSHVETMDTTEEELIIVGAEERNIYGLAECSGQHVDLEKTLQIGGSKNGFGADSFRGVRHPL